MRLHCISGLPRSGSTLLAALLRQNPRFHSAMTSPVVSLLDGLTRQMSTQHEFASCFSAKRRGDILKSVVDSYYLESAPVVFDTNRSWTGKMSWLAGAYPDARVICCVRDVGAIMESVERMLRRNPCQSSSLFQFKPETSVYTRADAMMKNDGFIGMPWGMLKEAWHGPWRESLVLVEYDDLVSQPGKVMRGLYEALGENEFAHNFEAVEYDAPDFDEASGMPGLHRVTGPVQERKYVGTVPPDLLALNVGTSFWREKESTEASYA